MKKYLLFLLTITLSMTGLQILAQDQIIPLWQKGNIPNAIDNSVKEETTHNGGIMRIAGVTEPTISVYLPKDKNKMSRASVLICPGGGYAILAAEHEGSDLAKWFNDRGVAAFVLKYRLPNEKTMTDQHQAPLLDAKQGMHIIKQNAAKWGIDPGKVGVMGFSAGGHLAATLSTHFNSLPDASLEVRPDFSILMYPVVSFDPAISHGGSRDNLLGKAKSEELIRFYSNEAQVKEDTPPAFLVHSQDDKAVPAENSINYFLALKKYNIPAELHLYPTGGHGYALRTEGKGSVANWPLALEGWMKSRGLINE